MATQFPVIERIYSRSKRLVIKFCPYRQSFIFTRPPGVSKKNIDAFLAHSQIWMDNQVLLHRGKDEKILEGIGSTFSILGDSYKILHDPLRIAGIFEGENTLYIGGRNVPEKHILKKLFLSWIKKRAYSFFVDYAHLYASELGCRFKSVTIRETISRWGSCSSDGRLSFNWRLMLAPETVAHYVCIHEVCHLKEMNHSQAFWDLVNNLCPSYKEQKLWLKKHGKSLYTFFPQEKG